MTYKDPVDVDLTGVNSDTLSWEFEKVNEEQDRLGLLKHLRKEGLCTRDVLAFITNQADLKSTRKDIDMVTCKSAMNEKIKDSRETLKIRQHAKSQAIKNYLADIGGRRFKLRKTIKSIKNIQNKTKLIRKRKYEKKIEHLRIKMSELLKKYEGSKAATKDHFTPTKVPERLQD